MGCTSSKGNTNSSTTTTTVSDNNQQLINDHFRNWLKSNRPKADEYVLNDVIATAPQPNDTDDYRTIVSKALDLLTERNDIKNANKLGKLVQKEVSVASPKKVAHTIDVLKQTAEKLNQGQIILDATQQKPVAANGETTDDAKLSGNQHGQSSSTEPGIALKEALETARVLFYKGKQAAIFANPNGGYTVRILDENDDALKQDGNLLRSIIVTEVKMRPKSASPPPPVPQAQTSSSALSSSVLPPASSVASKQLDEYEICDDFRRSIDAALKGLESIYHTSPPVASEHSQDTHIDKTLTTNGSPQPTSEDHPANLSDVVHQRKVINDSNEQEQPTQDISVIDIQPQLVNAVDNMNEIMVDIIEQTTESEIGRETSPPTHSETSESLPHVEQIVKQVYEHAQVQQTDEDLLKRSTLSDEAVSKLVEQNTVSTPPPTPAHEQETTTDDNRPELPSTPDGIKLDHSQDNSDKQTSNDDSTHTIEEVDSLKPDTAATETDVAKEDAIINKESPLPSPSFKIPTSISETIDNDKNILLDTSLPSVIASDNMNTTTSRSPTHNVTYTEIIRSESRDGEQTRRFITESFDGNPSKGGDDATTITTTHKIVTKSEFSTDPTLGEKIMEQGVQVITIKVRNETVTERSPSRTPDKDVSQDNQTATNNANTEADIAH